MATKAVANLAFLIDTECNLDTFFQSFDNFKEDMLLLKVTQISKEMKKGTTLYFMMTLQ